MSVAATAAPRAPHAAVAAPCDAVATGPAADEGSGSGPVVVTTGLNPGFNIIESGGLIIQSYQCDGKKIWGDLHDKVLFKNFPDLIYLIEKLINDKKYCSILLEKIYNNFLHSNKSIEKNLDKIFFN